jgi:hypothetical protein
MVARRGAYKAFVVKPAGKRPLERLRNRWEGLKWILKKWDGGHERG